eukprot:560509-Rhodomonas_salina.1
MGIVEGGVDLGVIAVGIIVAVTVAVTVVGNVAGAVVGTTETVDTIVAIVVTWECWVTGLEWTGLQWTRNRVLGVALCWGGLAIVIVCIRESSFQRFHGHIVRSTNLVVIMKEDDMLSDLG